MAGLKEYDAATGAETTGHVWDGDLKELNKPLPKWWLYVLYASIVWSIGYWVLYPTWPLAESYTRGVLGYSQRTVVADDIAAAKQAQAPFLNAISEKSVDEIRADPVLLEFVRRGGAAQFANNCAPCHGSGAQGFKGYPNLNDDDWLWGGTVEEIEATIRFGIRSDHDNTHQGMMPRFGIDQMLDKAQISDVAEFVLSLSGRSENPEQAARGAETFEVQCAACHGADGKGIAEMGAPNLADAIWLYGGRKEDVVETIHGGRSGMMPAWEGRIDPVSIRMLAIYVHSLGGGK